MTELSRKILENYQVRKTRKQKLAFIAFLKTYIPELQVQEGGFPKSRNLIIGDPQSAKVILGAHYDTCAVLPFPNFITPKKPLIAIMYSLLVIVPYLIAVIGLNVLLNLFTTDLWLHYWLSLAVYGGIMWLLLAGPANKHTANDNTSGIITLLEIYHALPQAQRNQVCFIFFDNEEKGLMGSGQFRKKHKNEIKDRLMINYDCVSDGDNILVGISKKANQKYRVAIARAFTDSNEKTVLLENLKKLYYPSDQAGFPMAIAVAALNHNKFFGYYMNRIHTKNDTVFDEKNILYLRDRTIQLVESI